MANVKRLSDAEAASDQLAAARTALRDIWEINGSEIGLVLDALGDYIDLQEDGISSIIDCIRSRLQAAKDKIERLSFV